MDTGARLDAIEKQLTEILDRLAAIEGARPVNERDNTGTTHSSTERAWQPYQRVPASARAFGFGRTS